MFRKIISLTIILTLIVNPASFAGFSPPPSVRAVTAGESLDSFVTVSDFFIPGTGKTSFETALLDPRQPLLLYLEDAHGNLSAQRHITQALDWISKQAKLREPWIALEGTGPGEIDHRVLSAFPHRPARMDVAEKFLRQGRLNGAEYFAALNPNVRLFGVDSEVLAERNRRKYRGLARLQPETGGPLLRLIRASQFLKKKIYYGDLVRLDQSAVQFEQDSRNLLKHLALLRNLAKRKGVSLDKYPHLSSALRGPAPSLSGSLNAAETLLEIRRLTEDLWKKLLDYREARDAFFMDRQVKFYQKLLSCSLLPEDYSKYVKDPRGYSLDSLKRRTQLYHFLLRPESLRPRKGDFEALEIASQPALEFYELARKRDQFLIANLEALVPKGPSRKTFFISGGFHRQGVSSLLRSKEIPFAVLTPKITQSGGEENYRRLLAQTSAVNLKSSFRIPEFRNKFRRALLTSLRADPFLPDGTKIRILERYRKSFPPELISISRSEVRNPEISPLVLTNDKSRDAAVNLIQFGEALIDRVGQSAGSGEAPVPLNGALLKGFFKSAFHYMTNDPKNPERILNLAETFMGAWEGWEWEVRFGKYERPYRVTRPFDPGEGKPVWREKSLLIEIDRETLRRFQSNQLAEFYLATTFFGRLLFGALSSDRNKIDLRRAEAEVAAALLRSFKNSEEEKRSFAGNFLQALMQTQQTALATEIRSRLTRQSRGKVKLQNGRIELGEQLGKGGFGTAYEAVLGRLKVVVKKAEGASLATSEGKARYDREAQIIAAFAQRGFTNLVGWREDFKENGEQYTVMDFAEGKPLSDLLPLLTEKEAIEVLIETARALEQMNSIGVFHRDVKPDNIIVHWDSRTRKVLQVKLIDYGLAKIFNWELARQAGIQPSRFVDEETGEERSQTQSGTGMGTPGYMSPEQAQGEQSKLGPQTDYYALGAMAYEMKAGYKAGDPPSKRATSAFDLITRQINGQYEDPSRLAGMPPELARLIKKAMAPELSERFQTAKELREALEHYLRISSEASPPPSQIQKPKELSGSTPQTPQTPKVSRLKRDRFQKRGPPTVKLLIGAVAALVLGVIGVIFLHSGEKSPPIPTTPTTVAPTIPKQAAPPSTVATTVPPEIPAVSPKPPKPEVKTPEKKTSSQGPDPETLSQAQRALEALKEASQKLPPDLQAFEGELTGLLTALDQSGKDLLAARKALLSSFQNLTEGLQVLERHLSKPEDRRGDPSKALIDRLKQAGPRILNEGEGLGKLQDSFETSRKALQDKIASVKEVLRAMDDSLQTLTDLKQKEPKLAENADFSTEEAELQKFAEAAKTLENLLKLKEESLTQLNAASLEYQLDFDLQTAQLALQWFEVLWLTHRSDIERDAEEGNEAAKTAAKEIPKEIEKFKLSLKELQTQKDGNKTQTQTSTFKQILSGLFKAADTSTDIVTLQRALWKSDKDFKNVLKNAKFEVPNAAPKQPTYDVKTTTVKIGGKTHKNLSVLTARKGWISNAVELPVTLEGSENTHFRFDTTVIIRKTETSVGALWFLVKINKPGLISLRWESGFQEQTQNISFGIRNKDREEDFFGDGDPIPAPAFPFNQPIVISVRKTGREIVFYLKRDEQAGYERLHTFSQKADDGKFGFLINIYSSDPSGNPNDSEILFLSVEGKTVEKVLGSEVLETGPPRSEVRGTTSMDPAGRGLIAIPFRGDGGRLLRSLASPASPLKGLLMSQRIGVVLVEEGGGETAQAERWGPLARIYGIKIMKLRGQVRGFRAGGAELENFEKRAAGLFGIPRDGIRRIVFLGGENSPEGTAMTFHRLAESRLIPMRVDYDRLLENPGYRYRNLVAAAWLARLPKDPNVFQNFPWDQFFQLNTDGSIALRLKQEFETDRLQRRSA